MKEAVFSIKSNRPLCRDVFELTLEGDTAGMTRAGQFVNIGLAGLYLRRPISVCDYSDGSITLLYKVVGRGTAQMSRMGAGEQLNLLVGLGNGFNEEADCRKPLLVGGGIGVAPLYLLAKRLLGRNGGEKVEGVSVVLGFNTKDDIFYTREFASLGARVYVATADGSVGCKGFVTDAIKEADIAFDYFYACGPMPMLGALSKSVAQQGELSLEARMGCGFGICMGCSIETQHGPQRVCKEGPVFRKEDLKW